VIFRRNTDARRNLRNQHINFHVYYEIDEQEAEYALSFDSYHKEGTGDACRHWVLLEVKEKLRNDFLVVCLRVLLSWGGDVGPMLTRWSNRVIFASRCVTRTAGIGTYASPLSGMPVPGWKCTFYSVWVRSV
jgi:hypothetical protein